MELADQDTKAIDLTSLQSLKDENAKLQTRTANLEHEVKILRHTKSMFETEVEVLERMIDKLADKLKER